jgi:hypothetical protein
MGLLQPVLEYNNPWLLELLTTLTM